MLPLPLVRDRNGGLAHLEGAATAVGQNKEATREAHGGGARLLDLFDRRGAGRGRETEAVQQRRGGPLRTAPGTRGRLGR